MKKPNLRFFQTIIYRYDAYLVQLVDGKDQNGNEKIDIDIIEKVVGNKTKNWKDLSEKFIIY